MPNNKSPTAADRHIGARIRMARLSAGLSQEKLGERLGITFQQVQKYENGTNRVGSGRLQEIGNILGVPVTFFFGDAEAESANAQSLLCAANTAESLRLLKAFSGIDCAGTRQAIVNLVVHLASVSGGELAGRSAPTEQWPLPT